MMSENIQRLFAIDIVKSLREAGHEALWAGGCVRDELLGVLPNDYDVATSARPEEVRNLFGRRRTLAIGASFGVISVLGGKGREPIEVATFRSDGVYQDGRHPSDVTYTTAEEDAKRRDFTMNGLFFDPLKEELIDFVGGKADLSKGIVRAIGDPFARFAEDKLRMLRAVRFATTFDFALEEATLDAIRSMANQIQVVSAERIGVEIRKILLSPHRSRGISLLHELDLLLPCFSLSWPTERVAEYLQHGLDTIGRMRFPSLPLSIAGLLVVDPKVSQGSSICRALRYTKKEGERVDWLLSNINLIARAQFEKWPRIQRVLVHPGSNELIALHEAKVGKEDEAAHFCKSKLQLPPIELDPPLLLTGDDLLAHGLSPGAHFAEILDLVRDKQLEQEVDSRQAALALVDEWLAGDRGNKSL